MQFNFYALLCSIVLSSSGLNRKLFCKQIYIQRDFLLFSSFTFLTVFLSHYHGQDYFFGTPVVRSPYTFLFFQLLLLLFGVRCGRPGESENTYQYEDHNPTQPPMEGRKYKIVGDRKERADHANRKTLALLLKPASPTPSNTGSLRSFQRDTERSTKVLRYWEVLQRGGANECYEQRKHEKHAPAYTVKATVRKINVPKSKCWRLYSCTSFTFMAVFRISKGRFIWVNFSK